MIESLGVGIIEGFFGPEWSWTNRHLLIEFLKSHQGDFYIYAPKRDPFLRKRWHDDHTPSMWNELKSLSRKCKIENIKFGIGLSPFEIHLNWNQGAKKLLRDKILKLEELETNYLGLFFDDMQGSPDLAHKQTEIVEFVRNITKQKILFCPTYYSHDPILDRVFGQRPENYLHQIGANISTDVQILWTGDKVISQVITEENLRLVESIIRRKPLIWDNYFANDGPKQCKFLKLKPLEGRDLNTYKASAGWAINPMNQIYLSKIVFLASMLTIKNNMPPQSAFDQAVQDLAGPDVSEFIMQNKSIFLSTGLDHIEAPLKEKLIQLFTLKNPYAADILDWLNGQYNVGAECLTD